MPFKELQSQKQDTEREKWIGGKPEKLFIKSLSKLLSSPTKYNRISYYTELKT